MNADPGDTTRHGHAESDRPLRLLLPWDGRHRLHSPLSAALPRGEGALRPGDRDRLDARGDLGPGAIPGRAVVRPDRVAQALPRRGARGHGPLDRPHPGSRGGGLARRARHPVRRERDRPRRGREPLGGRGGGPRPEGASGRRAGALRFWKPIGIVLVALAGSWMAERHGVGSILVPLAVVQGLAVVFALLIHEGSKEKSGPDDRSIDAPKGRDRKVGPRPQRPGYRRTSGSGPSSRRWSSTTPPMPPAACTSVSS